MLVNMEWTSYNLVVTFAFATSTFLSVYCVYSIINADRSAHGKYGMVQVREGSWLWQINCDKGFVKVSKEIVAKMVK